MLVIMGVFGCREPPKPASEAVASDAPDPAPILYKEVVADARRRAEKAEAVARRGRSALMLTRAGAEYIALARLTADDDDYARAQSLLDDAFAIENAVPPYMMRAQLHFTLHRLDAAEADFRQQVALPGETEAQRASEDLFAANLAYQRGDYAAAESGYAAVLQQERTPGAFASLAYARRRTGAFEEAEALYRESLALLPIDAVEPRTWTHLQLGLMDLERGRLDDALAHYHDAARELSGFWLIDEHIAEIRALRGETEAAREAYVELVARTGNPEFMDALAEVLRATGDEAGAKTWIAKARAEYEAKMQRFPEASYGHAVEHYLAFGTPAEALDLAEKNHALRPNTEAKIVLARARLGAGDVEGARSVIEDALATPVRTAELHAVASAIHRAAGNATRADEERALALAMNPSVQD